MGDMKAKIKALLTKAESSQFEAEAEAFNLKVAELMAKHGITEAELLAESGGDATQMHIVERRYVVLAPYSIDRMNLVSGIARAMGGHAYYFVQSRDGSKTRTKSKDHNTYAVLIGTEADIDRIEQMLESLNKQMDKFREQAQSNEWFSGMGQKKVWNATFIRAYSSRISQRIREIYQRAESEATGGAEIVLYDKKKLLVEYLKPKGLTTKKSSRKFDLSGASAGRAAADRSVIQGGLER